MPNPHASEEHPLDNPPPFHQKLLDYGERPYWSPDGARIAFVESNYGDICEIDLETRRVRNLTRDLGDHHSFLRVLFLHNGDYLLIGPKEFKDRDISRRVESELWAMDKDAKTPPVLLGRRIFEGVGVSTLAPRITYAVSGRNDPSLGDDTMFECHVTELNDTADGPKLGADAVFYRASDGRHPEPQDFRHNDREVIMAEYHGNHVTNPSDWKCIIKGVDLDTGAVHTYIDEPLTHNECEGIFPDGEHICLESSCDATAETWTTYKSRAGTTDLWKLKLDGSGRRVRMTHMYDRPPWRTSNANVSPDGRWLAFMVNRHWDEAGYGFGLGLMDLAAWEQTPTAQDWDTAPVGNT